MFTRLLATASLALTATMVAAAATPALAQPAASSTYNVPVTYYTLPNGLKVVLSRDTTAPTVVVAVYYRIGFRVEPKDRTGFAHLFEHMMFQGSANLGKMEFIRLVQRSGGILNGSTRFDFTNYFEVLPAHALETALWAEADRMRGLDITQDNLTNQQGVVSNEVKVNVLNQPYGGFPWLDLPQYANTNWYNAHNFYGDLKDLEAATLKDVQDFFRTYYAPANAVLVVYGDFEESKARALIDTHFGPITGPKPSAQPDLTEPRQRAEKRFTKKDALARKPALAFGYHMPARNTPEFYAMGLLDQILLQGEDSLLHQELVKKKGYAGSIDGGINLLGNMFNYAGPMLWLGSLIHEPTHKADEILESLDAAIARLQDKPLDQATVDRALVKLRSSLYDSLTELNGFGAADLLASFALFDDDPARINGLEAEFRKVTPALLQKTAREYLRRTNRTVLLVEPGQAAAAAQE
ncbi:pitrilysin family protein [Luteitalea sp. TBR-22]|uniref:M16 family metallopeptidase n=1 Tax=Luteitalea sp. TBR-22 TaxID=2802971 RepID=UPI001EF5EAE1|nr:pitrilysin family protein [Luteitalea sp. TBR-22]